MFVWDPSMQSGSFQCDTEQRQHAAQGQHSTHLWNGKPRPQLVSMFYLRPHKNGQDWDFILNVAKYHKASKYTFSFLQNALLNTYC